MLSACAVLAVLSAYGMSAAYRRDMNERARARTLVAERAGDLSAPEIARASVA